MRRDAARMRGRARIKVLVLATTAFFAAAVPSLAAPGSIADCEKIEEADAYNRCLAAFGPTRGERGATYPGVASEGGHSGKAADRSAARSHRRGGGAHISSGRGGRMRMEFTPGRRR